MILSVLDPIRSYLKGKIMRVILVAHMTGMFLLGTDGFWGITMGFFHQKSRMNLEVLTSGIHSADFPSDAFNPIFDLHPCSGLSMMTLGMRVVSRLLTLAQTHRLSSLDDGISTVCGLTSIHVSGEVSQWQQMVHPSHWELHRAGLGGWRRQRRAFGIQCKAPAPHRVVIFSDGRGQELLGQGLLWHLISEEVQGRRAQHR